jgi:8-oxo-dGTP pyrophosphatase MutT (NUDIX family)
MHDDELWQIFASNGEPIKGEGRAKEEFSAGELLCGVAHVWIWRRTKDQIEVLLQRRAEDKKTWPGYRDISAAGHINLGESPVIAALRESEEEIGLRVEPQNLRLVFLNRKDPPVYNELQWVYIYELQGDQDFTLTDGEVSDLEWYSLEKIKKSALDTDELHIVPHSPAYFAQLFQSI